MKGNPYQSPASADDTSPDPRKQAYAAVKIPATLLMVFGVMSLWINVTTVSPRSPAENGVPIALSLTSLMIIDGALRMLILIVPLAGRAAALLAIALATLPAWFPASPLLYAGFPVAIWVLVVLQKPHITAQFRR